MNLLLNIFCRISGPALCHRDKTNEATAKKPERRRNRNNNRCEQKGMIIIVTGNSPDTGDLSVIVDGLRTITHKSAI